MSDTIMPGDTPQNGGGIAMGNSTNGRRKIVVAVLLVAAFAVAGYALRDVMTLSNLARQEAVLRGYQRDYPVLVMGVAFVVYVAVTGANLPGATVLSLLYGWYFGFWRGLILVSFASTSGATLAFLLSRYFLRDAIQQRFGDRLKEFNKALEREGAYFLFTLRLIPLVPFFVINAVMGLTPMKTRTFWIVSQVGMLPGTAVYVYAGASVPDLRTLAEQGMRGLISPQLFAAFALLGLFPLIVRKVMQRFRPAAT